jgi:hypothetical protein
MENAMYSASQIQEAQQQLHIAIAYVEDSYQDLEKLQRKIEKKKKKLDMLMEKEKHIQECIESCELDIETFEKILG